MAANLLVHDNMDTQREPHRNGESYPDNAQTMKNTELYRDANDR